MAYDIKKIEIKYNFCKINIIKIYNINNLIPHLMSNLLSVIKDAGGCINFAESGSMSLKFTFANDSKKRVFSLVMKPSGEYEVKAFTDYENCIESNNGEIDIVVSTLSELLKELKAIKL